MGWGMHVSLVPDLLELSILKRNLVLKELIVWIALSAMSCPRPSVDCIYYVTAGGPHPCDFPAAGPTPFIQFVIWSPDA